jgi:hypothetical protein
MAALATLVLLVMAVRFGGVALLPSLLERVGKGLGLEITYARLDLADQRDWRTARARRRAAAGRGRGRERTTASPASTTALDWSMLLLGRLRELRRRLRLPRRWRARQTARSGSTVGVRRRPPPSRRAARSARAAPAVDIDAPFDFSLPLRARVASRR